MRPPRDTPSYAEIGIATNFSFLHGASHPREHVHRASELRLPVIGIADRNTLAGVVRVHSNAKTAGLTPLIGCRLVVGVGEEFRGGDNILPLVRAERSRST